MMRCLSALTLAPLLFIVAGSGWGQDTDRARQEKRIAEIEARLWKLTTGKLKAAAKPEFKDDYMTSADAKSMRGKWQAVRMVWGDGMIYPNIIAPESIAKLQ